MFCSKDSRYRTALKKRARFQGDPKALLKDLDQVVSKMLSTRGSVRRLAEAVRSIYQDATGLTFEGLYEDPDLILTVKKMQMLDDMLGDVFPLVERQGPRLKKSVK